jgi:hypothetical protein
MSNSAPSRAGTTARDYIVFAIVGIAVFCAGVGVKVLLGGPDGEEGGAAPSSRPSSASGANVLEEEAILASFAGRPAIKEDTYTNVPPSVGETVKKGTTVRVDPGLEAIFFTKNGPVRVDSSGVTDLTSVAEGLSEFSEFWPRLLTLHAEKREKFLEILNSRSLDPVKPEFRIDTPVGKLLVDRPMITWRDVKDDFPYRVRVPRSDGGTWEDVVKEPVNGAKTVSIPADHALERGVPSRVEIVSADGRVATGEFEYVSEEEARAVEEPIRKLASLLGNLNAYHFAAAYWYWDRGFFHRAGADVAMIAKAMPTERFPLESRVVMQCEIGNLPLAREEMKRLAPLPILQRVTVRPIEAPEK